MHELQRQIRKLATCEKNRHALRSQAQFALTREDTSDRFDRLLERLDTAEKTIVKSH